MEIHHDKHHQAYVTNLNKAVAGTELGEQERRGDLAATSTRCRRTSARPCATTAAATPTTRCSGRSWARARAATPTRRAGRGHQRRASAASTTSRQSSARPASTRFGSGWAWLVVKTTASSTVDSTPNQDSPLMQGRHADPGRRRLGARLLPEVPEPPARLHRRLVERRQLGCRGAELRRGEEVTTRSRDCRHGLADAGPCLFYRRLILCALCNRGFAACFNLPLLPGSRLPVSPACSSGADPPPRAAGCTLRCARACRAVLPRPWGADRSAGDR